LEEGCLGWWVCWGMWLVMWVATGGQWSGRKQPSCTTTPNRGKQSIGGYLGHLRASWWLTMVVEMLGVLSRVVGGGGWLEK